MAKRFKYFPSEYGKEFKLLKDCQNLSAELYNATAAAPKGHRTICKDLTDTGRNLIFAVRRGNSYPLGSEKRCEEQKVIMELIQQLSDLLPVVRRCRCISIGQEGEITKKIDNIKFRYEMWVDSDNARIKEMEK